MRTFLHIIILVGVFLVSSCIGTDTSKFVSMDEVKYVSEFPHTGTLNEIECDYDEIGLNAVKVVDTLLVISHRDCWRIISVSGEHYGRCFSRGQGPEDFASIPYSDMSAFKTENDTLYAYVYDGGQDRQFSFNITEFLLSREQHFKETVPRENLPALLWSVISTDSAKCLLHVPTEKMDGFKRFLYTDGSMKELEVTIPLSNAKIVPGVDPNLLTKVTGYDPSADMFVEGMMYLNQLNIYSGNEPYGITVCVGDELDNLSRICAKPKPFRINNYLAVAAWEKGFCGVYSGVTEMEWQMGKQTHTDLHFFDWSGNPIFKTTLPISVLSFDIDFDNKVLYAVDQIEDRLVKYDATPIVELYESL